MQVFQRVPLFLLFALVASPHLKLRAFASEVTGEPEQEEEDDEVAVFFLSEASDGLCLGPGARFQRCDQTSLWYATGTPSHYSFHLVPEFEDGSDLCLDRKSCHSRKSTARLHDCTHCGAIHWNLEGEEESGYMLTEDYGKNCLVRDIGSVTARIQHCTEGYSTFFVELVTAEDLAVIASPKAQFIAAAVDGDLAVATLLLPELQQQRLTVDVRGFDDMTALVGAASGGHGDVVSFLLDNGADVNARDKDLITALMEAAIMGHMGIVDALVEKGAQVDARAASGVTALWFAASEGQESVVDRLLTLGADPGNVRTDGITALMAAALGGHLAVVQRLLDAGAAPDALTVNDEVTALMNAAELGHAGVVSALVAAGANPSHMSRDVEGRDGLTALMLASSAGNLDIMRLLIETGAPIDGSHDEGVTALMYAAAGAHKDAVNFLLTRGADCNAAHGRGGTALMEAATSGDLECVRLLVDSEKCQPNDIDRVDVDGVTALVSASAAGHAAVVEYLVETCEADVNVAAASGGTSIMFAASGGWTDVVDRLLASGARVDERAVATPVYVDAIAKEIADGNDDVEPHRDGVTALMVAAMAGHGETVSHLLDAGADVNLRDEFGQSAFLGACSGKFWDVAVQLLRAGTQLVPGDETFVDADTGNEFNTLWVAVNDELWELAELLLDAGVRASYTDPETQRTVLIEAASRGHVGVVERLVSAWRQRLAVSAPGEALGAAIAREVDQDGTNALLAASAAGYEPVVDLLLSLPGCRSAVDTRDRDGTTALMLASWHGATGAVSSLVAAGANVNAQNNDGHTPLMFALNGLQQVEEMLGQYEEILGIDSQTTVADVVGEFGDGLAPEATDGAEIDDGTESLFNMTLQPFMDVVDLLERSGADRTIEDSTGHIASDFQTTPNPNRA